MPNEFGIIKRDRNVMPRGGKRAGAGRKPVHGKRKSSYFATRITPDLRAALDREAKRSGHSLSQEIERRLRDSVQPESAGVWGSARNRALGLLVGRIARGIETYTGENWITNDYAFRALRAAVEELFRIWDVEKAPPGRDRGTPEKVRQLIKSSDRKTSTFFSVTAEQVGQRVASAFWIEVMILEMPNDLTFSTTEDFRLFARMRHMLGIKAVMEP
jgi:hypothetical protein